jgi:hypothetical protein
VRGQGEVLSWVEAGGFMYWEVSAKTGYKIQELLDKVEHAVLTGENPGVVGPHVDDHQAINLLSLREA